MGTPAQFVEQSGFAAQQAARARKDQLEDEQRQAKLAELSQSVGLTEEQRQQAIRDLYAKDPSALKQHVENLGRRLIGKQPQPVTPPNASAKDFQAVTAKGVPAEAQLNQLRVQQLRNEGAAAKGGAEKAVWLTDANGQQKPYELKNGAYVPIQAPEGAAPAPAPAKAPAAESEFQKAELDYKNKVLALAQAKQAAATNPNSPASKAALLRAQGEAERSQAYMIRAKAGAFGTDLKGNPLPGANVDAAGNPIGSMFGGNVKPTAQEIGRADLAASALEQMGAMKDILTKRSDLFGPAAGHITNFTQWLGTQDPDAQRFRAAARVAADHLAGVFGGRSEAALKAIYDVIGKNITNPAAAKAALDQMGLAAQKIQQRGTRHTVGGNPQNPNSGPAPKSTAPLIQYSPSTGKYRYSTDGGKTWQPGQPPQNQ